MNIKEITKHRRAVKKYDINYQISDADFNELMEQAMQAPSSFNIQHWRFVDVQDKEARQQIREAAWDQAQVTEASRLLVLCADVKAWEKEPAQYWNNAPQAVSDMMVPMIKDFYDGREWIQHDEALRSVGIAAEALMMNATAMGFDTCPMIGFDQDVVGKIINLPDDHIIGMMITVGKRGEEPFPHGGRLPLDKTVMIDKF
jgi:nitroreductase